MSVCVCLCGFRYVPFGCTKNLNFILLLFCLIWLREHYVTFVRWLRKIYVQQPFGRHKFITLFGCCSASHLHFIYMFSINNNKWKPNKIVKLFSLSLEHDSMFHWFHSKLFTVFRAPLLCCFFFFLSFHSSPFSCIYILHCSCYSWYSFTRFMPIFSPAAIRITHSFRTFVIYGLIKKKQRR